MRVVGGSLLVAGTTIGAGMLALPVTAGLGGFFPTLILFFIVWLFMSFTAFLLLETNIAMKGDINLVTMAKRSLGRWGEVIAWVFYLVLLYCLTAAYITGSSQLFIKGVGPLLGVEIPSWVGPLPFILLFGALIYLGMKPIDYVNRLLMFGLVVAYLLLIVVVSPLIEGELLLRAEPKYLIPALSIVITSFGYHIIIPSLVTYLHRDLKKIRLCLLIGAIVPLVVYVLWEALILGVVPLAGLEAMVEEPASSLTGVLRKITERPGIGTTAGFFSFFAIITSFLGVTASLHDFLRDGLKVKESTKGRLLIVLLTFLPPLLFAILYPDGFIMALDYGGIAVAVLLGMLPIAMVWGDRYVNKRNHPYRVGGGKVSLVIGFLFFVGVIVCHFI